MAQTYLGQMFAHRLDVLKGWCDHMIDIDGFLSSNVNINSTGLPLNAGTCVHVQSTQVRGAGTPAGTSNNTPDAIFELGANLGMMGCFVWAGSADYDVTSFGVPAGVALGGSSSNGPPDWVPVFPTGKLRALVAIGGYELETTEFDTAQTYSPNDGLRAVTSNTDANGGKLTNQDASGGQPFATTAKCTRYTDTLVGVVSHGSYTNKNGKSALAFWPVYLPGTR